MLEDLKIVIQKTNTIESMKIMREEERMGDRYVDGNMKREGDANDGDGYGERGRCRWRK